MMFSKACQLKKGSLSHFPSGNIVSLVNFLYFFYKIMDNSKMIQGITEL